jgi:mannonate dehydratase
MSNLQDVQDRLPKLAMVVTPPSDAHLRLAAQIGVRQIVGRYEGGVDAFHQLRARVEAANLELGVIEGYLPLQRIVNGAPGRDDDIAELATLIEAMGQARVPVLCYNWMPTLDMTRTTFNVPDRGGALVNAFEARPEDVVGEAHGADHEVLWETLQYFLERILPVAEANGVTLAMHPDDPPLPRLRGQAFIMTDPAAFERLIALSDSPSNKIAFCQGCFSEMGVDVPATIRRLGRSIGYVHFRDVRGTASDFREAFHDAGQTDMFEAMRAYRDAGFSGPMRPDHVPRMEGETGEASGYTMLGRLFAVGYMKGLMEGVARELRQGA